MIVSGPLVKKFLLDLIRQANYPGEIVEFVVAVKAEVNAATFEPPNVKEE